ARPLRRPPRRPLWPRTRSVPGLRRLRRISPMAKKRVHEIAKAQGITSKELLAILQNAGLEVKAAASSVDEAEALAALGANGSASAAATPAAEAAATEPAKASD